ncbi:hypothetical protein SKAU_G00345720 [Synaphobranchus kaupii]|uniref:Protein CBFA2T3 n=1 Tax=Synaphobranchus kaupii TaxID=118154 RepID=A0A9Q1EJJ4_SYNKA|nr:hypothetical protein SKAU_G00345720 [Synaphobranchus kaupii]
MSPMRLGVRQTGRGDAPGKAEGHLTAGPGKLALFGPGRRPPRRFMEAAATVIDRGRSSCTSQIDSTHHATSSPCCQPGSQSQRFIHAYHHAEREQPLAHGAQWGALHPERLQQRAGHVDHGLALHPAAATGPAAPGSSASSSASSPRCSSSATTISPEIGERVRTLVLGLVNSTLTIEEFHSKLQEATNFPLRPLRHSVPQGESASPAEGAVALRPDGQADAPRQYLAQHEQLLLDANASSPLDSSEILMEISEHGKRKTPDRTKDSSADREPMHVEHQPKRPCTHYRLEDMALAHHYRDAYRHMEHREARDRHRQAAVHGARQEEVIDHRLTDREWAEEWKHLDNLLNCIMDMVEKTRRSLTVLRRCQEGRPRGDEPLDPALQRRGGYEKRETQALEIHRDFLHRPSGYLPEEIWRKAGPTSIPLSPALKQLQSKQEEAVNEVKRQAMSELQKAVSDAERKAHEMISVERSKMERALAEAKRQASEDALTVINQQEDSSESCWNCGRKASETCSGCNTARYCGSFCQHKDWEKHHHVCGQGLQGPPGGSSAPQGTPSSSSSAAAPPTHSAPPASLSLPGQANGNSGASVTGSPKEASSSGASRSTTPATPALLDSASR